MTRLWFALAAAVWTVTLVSGCSSETSGTALPADTNGPASSTPATTTTTTTTAAGADPAAVKGFCDGYYTVHNDLQTAAINLSEGSAGWADVAAQSQNLTNLLNTYEPTIKDPSFTSVLPAERTMLGQIDSAVAAQDKLSLLQALTGEPADIVTTLAGGVCRGQKYW